MTELFWLLIQEDVNLKNMVVQVLVLKYKNLIDEQDVYNLYNSIFIRINIKIFIELIEIN
jgi:hypothetical protein